jgi:RimJ/RimL family protein N-acetyltransferase
LVPSRLSEIRTQRLLLRPWRESDREPFAAINADPAVMQHFPATLSRCESDAAIDRIEKHWDEHAFGFWALELVGDAPFIGCAGLARPSFDAHFTPCVEVGWRIAREHWGRGYATEAAQAAVHRGFLQLALEEIVSFTVPGNHRSLRVMEKLGMRREPGDDFDHPRLPANHRLQRHVLYRLTREQWELSPISL